MHRRNRSRCCDNVSSDRRVAVHGRVSSRSAAHGADASLQLLTFAVSLTTTLSDDNAFVDWRTLGQTCSRGDPGSAICIQRLDDSLNSSIHTTYRSLLHSSSMHEPRDPPSVVNFFCQHKNQYTTKFHKQSCKKPKTRDRFKAQRAAAEPILTDSNAAPN